MTTFFDIDAANARLPEVRELLILLRRQREELIQLRDRLIELQEAPAGSDVGIVGRPEPEIRRSQPDEAESTERGGTSGAVDLGDAALIRLRMQGVIDQMQAVVAQIDAWGITLRDIESGLIDFPALVNGRQVWLCWRLGEDAIAWWHELNRGFSGRRRLIDLG
jgi:hypothetical protein